MRRFSTIFLLLAALFGSLGVVGLTQAASGSASVATLSGAAISYAGSPAETGWLNPSGSAVSQAGDLYVADAGTNLIRKINTATGVAANFSGHEAYAVGSPEDVEFDSSGVLYMLDYNGKIWKISTSGSKTVHYQDATGAIFKNPKGIALDASGNVYISDSGTRVISKITPTGTVSVLAGSGSSGSADGIGTAASFVTPEDIDISSDGATLYVADSQGTRVRAINIASTAVTTFAGNSSTPGVIDGTGVAASFSSPKGLHVSSTSIFVADNSALRSIDIATGSVTTIAGSNTAGFSNGTGASAQFLSASSVSVSGDAAYVVETGPARIRKVVISTGVTTTLSGVLWGADGTAAAARFDDLADVAFPSSDGKVWASDGYNLRRVDPATGNVTTVWSSNDGQVGDVVSNPSGTEAYFVYGSSLKKITLAGVVSSVAGSETLSGFVDGEGSAARFNTPRGLALSPDGSYILIADEDNHRIRKVVIATSVVSTVLGTGTKGHTDGSSATALISDPVDVAITPQGVAFVQLPDTFTATSSSNNSVRFLRNADSTVATLVAMANVSGTFKSSGSSCSSSLCDSGAMFTPRSVSYDSVHQVLLVGGYGKIVGITGTPEVFSIAGSSATYRGAVAYKDGPSSSARFTSISGLSVLSNGSIIVADKNSNVLRILTGVSIDVNPTTTTTTTTTTVASPTTTTTLPSPTFVPAPVSTLPSTKAPIKGSAIVISKDGSSQSAAVAVTDSAASVSSGTLAVSFAKSEGFSPSSFVLVPGKTLSITGSGFKSGSSVEIWIFSTPTLLGQATVASDGSFTKTVTIPSNLSAGAHAIQIEGVDPQGVDKALSLGVQTNSTTVPGDGTSLPSTGPFSSILLILAASVMGFFGILYRKRTA
jgi:sugar lactone lactonase YvrE